METFKIINQVPTRIICFGKDINDQDLSSSKHLVLVFPGNPGVIEYYRDFLQEIYEGLSKKYPNEDIPVWGISHAGHQVDNLEDSQFPNFEENLHLYSLKGQIDHKVAFISSHIPSHIKIIGVGHSIGCKTWSEVIKTIDEQKEKKLTHEITKCFMLFPTLERMRETSNGKVFTAQLPFQFMIERFLWLIMQLPTALHKILLSIYFMGRSVPKHIIDASLQLFNFDVYRRVLYMARCEMNDVVDLDVKTLESNLNKFYFYFGKTDGWCPLEYVDQMKQRLPKMRFNICDNGFQHAFVVKNSADMAAKVCDLIDIPNNLSI